MKDLEADDISMVQELGGLTPAQLLDKIRQLQNLAYQLGLEEGMMLYPTYYTRHSVGHDLLRSAVYVLTYSSAIVRLGGYDVSFLYSSIVWHTACRLTLRHKFSLNSNNIRLLCHKKYYLCVTFLTMRPKLFQYVTV